MPIAASVNAGRLKKRGGNRRSKVEIATAAIHKKAGLSLGSTLEAFILFLTVITVLATGILAAYGAIIAILRLLAPQTTQSGGGKPVLVPNRAHAAHAGGD